MAVGRTDENVNRQKRKSIDWSTKTTDYVIRNEMRKGAYAFFPASRHEIPAWLNPKSLKT